MEKFVAPSLGWSSDHAAAFTDYRSKSKSPLRFSHRDPDLVLCLRTNSYDKHWAVAATECTAAELEKPLLEQVHQQLAFLSVTFSDC